LDFGTRPILRTDPKTMLLRARRLVLLIVVSAVTSSLAQGASPPQPANVPEAVPGTAVGWVDPSSAPNVEDPLMWLGNNVNEGFFIQYDYAFWAVSAPNVTVIGDPNSERYITTPDGSTIYAQNSMNTAWLGSVFGDGHRLEFGNVEQGQGWMMSLLHVKQSQSQTTAGALFVPTDQNGMLNGYYDGNGDGIDDDLNGNGIYGRNGQYLTPPSGSGDPPDAPAPVDTGDMVSWLVNFGSAHTNNVVEIQGFELMGIRRSMESNADTYWDLCCGVRFFQVKDRLSFAATGGFFDASSWNTEARNDIIGPQIGLRWNRSSGYFTFAVEGRFLAGVNFQRAEQAGYIASNADGDGQNEPVDLVPTGFNHTLSNEAFAPLGELRIETIYKVNPWFGFRVGYTGLVAGGISRAGEKVVYELPYFGLSDRASSEVIFCNALTLGAELNR
jgi:hypothetical protein